MLNTKDYSKMTLEELKSEKHKLKSQKITMAVIIGFLVGLAVWSTTHKGGILTFIFLIAALLIASNYSKKQKGIQAEINRREGNR
ncbi:MAG: hypothetical protein ACK41O_03390 [Runella zeae]